MRGLLTLATALVSTPPALASTSASDAERAVIAGVDAFFTALRSEDKTALREQMMSEAVIFIHNRMNPDQHGIVFFPVPDHLANWERSNARVDERMTIASINVEGDMAQVWGPYRFITNGRTTHCGINSMSLVNTVSGWKVGNTSFTMERPSECDRLGAPPMPEASEQ